MKLSKNGTEYFLDALENMGVRIIFGFPGETSLPLYIGLQRRRERLRHVLARCPRCAGYMADAYARISGQVGVCDAPGGIGSPFLVPALHEANNSSIPVLAIASGVSQNKKEDFSTSTCDQQNLFKPITKKVFCVEDVAVMAAQCIEAVKIACSPRTGPVFLEIPAQFFTQTATIPLAMPKAPCHFPYVRPEPSPTELQQVKNILEQTKCPVILAGGGIHLSQAVSALQDFYSATGIPVATTLNGKGSIPENHRLALGVAGAKGHLETNLFLQQTDCILVLGSKLGDKSSNHGKIFSGQQKIIHVDNAPTILKQSNPDYLPICCDIKIFLEKLQPFLSKKQEERRIMCRQPFWQDSPTSRLCAFLSKQLPDQSILVADASVSSGWAGAAIQFTKKGQRLISPRGSGSISYALPAAIGAHFASPTSQIIAIGGDGGFAMSMHEMETAVRYQIPILFILLNNNSLGLIDKHATQILKGQKISQNFYDIPWAETAKNFGWKAISVTDIEELEQFWKYTFPATGPTLIEYRIPSEELSPDYLLTLENKKRRIA